MFKRSIHSENYDAEMSVHRTQTVGQSVFKHPFLRKILKNIQLISILINFFILVILVYAVIEIRLNLQALKQEILIEQTYIKKLNSLIRETIQIKPASQPVFDSSPQLVDMVEYPSHLKYMGVFRSGTLQKAFIETEQGGILFAPQQMVEQDWKLKGIFEDYLILESIGGQEVTIYKEKINE